MSRTVNLTIGADSAGYADITLSVPGNVKDVRAWIIRKANEMKFDVQLDQSWDYYAHRIVRAELFTESEQEDGDTIIEGMPLDSHASGVCIPDIELTVDALKAAQAFVGESNALLSAKIALALERIGEYAGGA